MKYAALLATTILAGPAFADVTPEQVWANYKDLMTTSPDAKLTVGSEERSGDTLTVRDVVYAVNSRNEQDIFGTKIVTESSSTLNFGDLSFTDNGDGTVTWGFPAEMTASAATKTDTAGMKDEQAFDMVMGFDNITVVSSGTPEEMSHYSTADRMTISVPEITGTDGSSGSMQIVVNGIEGTYSSAGDELIRIASDLRAASVEFDMNMLEGGDSFKMDGEMQSLAMVGTIDYPRGVSSSDPAELYRAGMAVDLTYSTGGGTWAFDVEAEDGPMAFELASTSADGLMSFNQTGMEATSNGQDIKAVVRPAGMPMAFEITADVLGYALQIPMGKSEEPVPAGIDLTVGNLVVPDMVWGMMDPQQVLPRDPVNVRLNLDAMVSLFTDLYDPGGMVETAGMMPGEVQSVTLKELSVSAVGASLDGTGEVTIDNDDKDTFGGAPVPLGSVTLNATGVNGLMANLTTLGLLPQDQAMMAQMMMGMFAKPVGEDGLTSTIEFKPGGQILANGQRIR